MVTRAENGLTRLLPAPAIRAARPLLERAFPLVLLLLLLVPWGHAQRSKDPLTPAEEEQVRDRPRRNGRSEMVRTSASSPLSAESAVANAEH